MSKLCSAMHREDIKDMDIKYAQSLSMEELEDMVLDCVVTAADGCEVEPDGTCEHGHRSPLLVLGMI